MPVRPVTPATTGVVVVFSTLCHDALQQETNLSANLSSVLALVTLKALLTSLNLAVPSLLLARAFWANAVSLNLVISL